MKKSRFSESQIIKIIKEQESGKKTADVCREYGISQPTFYNWKKKYSGMDQLQLKKLRGLSDENKRLKRMFADLSLDHELLKEVLEKKF
jgi:putative transposase